MSSAMAVFPKTQAMYSLEACENLMEEYCERGGECVTLEEGSLGLGLVLCYGGKSKNHSY